VESTVRDHSPHSSPSASFASLSVFVQVNTLEFWTTVRTRHPPQVLPVCQQFVDTRRQVVPLPHPNFTVRLGGVPVAAQAVVLARGESVIK
jgi:hypothetical protein